MIYNMIVIICSIIIPMIIIKEPIKILIKKEKNRSCIREYKYEFIFYILIVIGCLIRCIGIEYYPNGLNVDEASARI